MNSSSLWDLNPLIVIWETTRACALACRHCRAEAIPRRHPQELSTEEALRFVDEVVRAAPRVFVLTGGDPMVRPDLAQIIGYATGHGLKVALSPSATPRLLRADLGRLYGAGLHRISLSLDGACARSHDAFRGVRGTWNWTMRAIEAARSADIEVQINTTFTRQNLEEFDAFAALLDTLRPVLWSVFQLVPTGRAKEADLLTAEETEELFVRLWELSRVAPYEIKTTEGMHYRRVSWQRWTERPRGLKPSPIGTNDGRGFVFVSHTGEIFPSGFLPLAAGSVRDAELIEVYREHALFRRLRDPNQLRGKCGACEFRGLCGGSRARAYAMTGDYMAADPLCSYQPVAWKMRELQPKLAAVL
jgi:radical SAM protein